MHTTDRLLGEHFGLESPQVGYYAMQDTRAAIRYVRAHAQEFHL